MQRTGEFISRVGGGARGAGMQEADRARLERVYKETAAQTWRAVYAACGVREVADDAVAEAFAQAGRRASDIRDMRAWVRRAALRIAAGELSARRRDGRVPGEETAMWGETDRDLEVLELMRLLDDLPRGQRAAFVLMHVFGYSASEAGLMTGKSDVVTRVQAHRARKRLSHAVREAEER